MLDLLDETTAVALVGLIGGVVLGLAARMGRFCTLGAIEDVWYGGSGLRLRMWGVALGVGIAGTSVLAGLDLLDWEQSFYLAQPWNPAASVIGGLAFGYGMALAGNCGYGALARLGGGDLRSFVIVLVMGLSAYLFLSGPFAATRLWLFAPGEMGIAATGAAQTLADATGLPGFWFGLVVGISFLAAMLADRDLRAAPRMTGWAALAGLAIVSGWAGTAWVATHGFAATLPVSHTFAAPIGETMLYAMTASGNTLSFGTGSVAGVLVGACIGSLFKGHFRWEACDDPRELRRQILGAFLMGMGAVIAGGCSVGQGLSAFSVLAYSAPVTLLAIVAGAVIGLRQLVEGFAR